MLIILRSGTNQSNVRRYAGGFCGGSWQSVGGMASIRRRTGLTDWR